ncbi:hypothetical protein, partial [Bacteroides ovatus]|uniref:hypothetical protein n=1 Tax=Bacteroides koreensis TaxID=1912896 RepID=UPI0035E408DB
AKIWRLTTYVKAENRMVTYQWILCQNYDPNLLYLHKQFYQIVQKSLHSKENKEDQQKSYQIENQTVTKVVDNRQVKE